MSSPATTEIEREPFQSFVISSPLTKEQTAALIAGGVFSVAEIVAVLKILINFSQQQGESIIETIKSTNISEFAITLFQANRDFIPSLFERYPDEVKFFLVLAVLFALWYSTGLSLASAPEQIADSE